MQLALGIDHAERQSSAGLRVAPFKTQLLKWIGNKQRFAHEIIGFFPERFGTYYEPFVGSGAVLGTLAPRQAVASDSFAPLIEIWKTLRADPDQLKAWYSERQRQVATSGKVVAYEKVKADYNASPNGADLLFLCRSCYGGVVRFRQKDGYMSTPCGVHEPVSAVSFGKRVDEWGRRVAHTQFKRMEYQEALWSARSGDLVYCDPPYSHTQAILYGAQNFDLGELLRDIAIAKRRGVNVALSIDGSKKSGNVICDIEIPDGLFKREVAVNCGRSMLRRFQMEGQTLETELVTDRLLLTY